MNYNITLIRVFIVCHVSYTARYGHQGRQPPRYPQMIGLKLPSDLEQIRRHAREDDRTVSGYLRRLLTSAMQQRQQDHDRSSP